LKRRLWTRLRLKVSKIADPYDDDIPSYKEMALENAEEALRIAEMLDDGPYPDPPVAGVDYDEAEVSEGMGARIDARMEEVYVFTQRVRERRAARRRRVGAAVAVGALVLTSGAGASALISGTTGISALDDLLALHAQHQAFSPGGPVRADRRPPHLQRLATSVLMTTTGHGLARNVGAAVYRDGVGDVCFVLAAPGARGSSGVSGDGGCDSPANIRRRLSTEPAYVLGTTVNRTVVLTGFVAANVVRLSVTGPSGPLAVRLAEAPAIGARQPFRAFIAAISPAPLSGGSYPLSVETRYMDRRNYEVRARLKDGRMLGTTP
jgi:hypothetical protein